MKSRSRSFTWDHCIVLIVSLIGFAFTVNPLGSPATKSDRNLASSEVIDLGCMNDSQTSNTYFRNRSPVRIKGRICYQHRSQPFDSSLKIFNLSADKGGVAFIQDQQFLSSELPLIPGNNEILIEWEDKLTGISLSTTAHIFTEPR